MTYLLYLSSRLEWKNNAIQNETIAKDWDLITFAKEV